MERRNKTKKKQQDNSNQRRVYDSQKAVSSGPTLSSHQFDPIDAPAVIRLEKENDGFLKVKVESDIMAYILYCYYDEFATIQQAHHVAITWSGLDNTVMFCLTSYGDATQLHLATQHFLSLYHRIASNLVTAPLRQHVTNITLHQYHKATYAVKQFHPKAMIKEVKTTGQIALYCHASEVIKCRRTFLSSLHSKESFDDFTTTKKSSKSQFYKQPFNKKGKPKTLPNGKHSQSFSNGSVNTSSLKKHQIRSSSTILPKHIDPSHSRSKSRQETLSDDGIVTQFSEASVPRALRLRYSEDGGSTSNSSSGYGSNSCTLRIHDKNRTFKNEYFDTNKRQVLPPIPRQTSPRPMFRLQNTHSFPRNAINPTGYKLDYYYYDDIQHSGDVGEIIDPEHNLAYVKETYHRHDRIDSPSNIFKHNEAISPMPHPPRISPLLQKPSIIPKLETPFRFMQHHKKCFEVTTPLGITVAVFDGDVTDADCDVIVNVTNSQLHINGELAWAVAKYGLFEIPKLTKLHSAINGPVMESKVVVTPSVGLPCSHIVHAVAPKWNCLDAKKSKKLLRNTYKNVFNEASLNLGATSIALPVIGLEKSAHSEDGFPLHIATEVMYQSLIAFLKTGSSTIRHIRFIDNDPDHVNLIVTSIKPKIENVTYDSRYVQQHQKRNRTLNSQTSFSDSNIVSSPERNMLSPSMRQAISPVLYGRRMYDDLNLTEYGRRSIGH